MKLTSWPVLIGTAVLIIGSVVISIMYRLGSFKGVEVAQTEAAGTYILVAREHMGAYHGIASVITEVETWARANGEPCALTFGEYQDNPETVDEDRLRSRGGCIVSSQEKADELKKVLPVGTTVSELKIEKALTASFDGSPSIGPLKVYPKIFEQMKSLDLASSGPVLEIYEVISSTSGRTRYVFPVKSLRE